VDEVIVSREKELESYRSLLFALPLSTFRRSSSSSSAQREGSVKTRLDGAPFPGKSSEEQESEAPPYNHTEHTTPLAHIVDCLYFLIFFCSYSPTTSRLVNYS